MTLNQPRRFALELLATADAVRSVRQTVAQMVHDGHPAVAGHAETATVLAHGLDVADALVALAARLATEKAS